MAKIDEFYPKTMRLLLFQVKHDSFLYLVYNKSVGVKYLGNLGFLNTHKLPSQMEINPGSTRLSNFCTERYGNTSYGVSSPGIQN